MVLIHISWYYNLQFANCNLSLLVVEEWWKFLSVKIKHQLISSGQLVQKMQQKHLFGANIRILLNCQYVSFKNNAFYFGVTYFINFSEFICKF